MTTKNIFGHALKDLLEASKDMLSRKEWTVLLGVSDAAISQWISGKTFPAPEKIKILISIYRGQELDDQRQKKLDYFLSVIEMPIDLLWTKVPARVQGLKASDYILDEFEQDMKNMMSHLYYDLKQELQKQFSREILIHKEFLSEKLLESPKEEEVGVYARSRKNKLLAGAIQEEVNRNFLHTYHQKIKSYHRFSNALLEYVIQQDHDENKTLDFDLDILLQECKDKIKRDNSKPFSQGSVNLNTSVRVSGGMEYKYPLPFGHLITGGYPFDEDNVFCKESVSLFFKSPFFPEKNLMHVEINKVAEQRRPRTPNEQSVYCTFDFSESINNPQVFTDDVLLNTFAFEAAPDYSMKFNLDKGLESTEWYESFPNKLNTILNSNKKQSRLNQLKSYLITPELTNSNYLVEILKIGKNKKIPIENVLPNMTVFLIIGNIVVSPKKNPSVGDSKKQFLSSLFDRSKVARAYVWNEISSFADLNDSMKYEIESRGQDSIALIVHYKEEDPFSFREKPLDGFEFSKIPCP